MNFRRAILANARTVARLSKADMQLLMPVLEDARLATARGMAKWIRKMKPDDAYTIATHRQLLVSLDESMKLMKRRLFPAMARDLQSEGTVAAREAAIAMRHAAEAGAIKFMASARPMRFNNAAIVASSSRSLMSRHETSALRYADRQGQLIRQSLASGLVRGESVGQTVGRLMKKPLILAQRMTDNDKADAIAENHFFRSRADAERLVRTENIYAANEVQQDALLDDNQAGDEDPENNEGGWLKRWDATFDSRTCEACSVMDGEVREPDEEFEPGVMHPPLHPNCRCTIVPWREGWVL